MKVKICYTVEVDDHTRQKINEWYGRDGLATREDVQNWYRTYGESMNDDLAETVVDIQSD